MDVQKPKTKPTDKFFWVQSTSNGKIPADVVIGGHEGAKGKTVPFFVGRCVHEKHLIPAKISTATREASYTWNGTEHVQKKYEVLCCKSRYQWVATTDGKMPPKAIAAGKTAKGETLYVGRAIHEGDIITGKIHPSLGSIYVPFNGKEFQYKEYDALVSNN